MPSVSIALPVHNAAEFLPDCLASIQAQTLSDWELIAVDDGSTDASSNFLQRAAQTDPRVRLLSPGRVGIVPALNLAVAHASSAFIARMDADDLMLPERLQRQLDFLREHPDVALVSCKAEIFPEPSRREGYTEYQRWINACITPEEIAANLYVESPFPHPSVLLRKNIFESVGGYKEGFFPEDYELWLRMAASGFKMGKVPECLLLWRDHRHRLSRTDPRYSREAFDNLRAEYLHRDSRICNASEIVIWGAGRVTRRRARLLLNKGVGISRWIDIDPRKIGKTFDGRPVFPHSSLNRTPRPLVLVYVTNHGARDQISEILDSMGYSRGHDYLAVG